MKNGSGAQRSVANTHLGARFCIVLAAAMALAACRDGSAPAAQSSQAASLPQVSVMRPVPREVREQLDLSGTVAPSATVTLIARVQGVLKEIGFADGAYVKQGQVLFRIEPDTYRAQLTYDQAALDNADQELVRQKQLTSDNATSESTLQKAQTTRDQALAKRDMSRINLAYTEIRAPFAGRIGARAFDVGNLVGASDSTKLATLDRIQPVYVNFTLNERDANRIGLFTQPPRTVRVNALGAAAGQGQGEDAALEFVDTRVDPSSGAVKLRADIVNRDAHLIPGMSVEVHIPAGAPHNVLLVPDTALLRDQAGASVLIVNGAGVIEKRAVVTGGLYGSQRAVTSGLTANDQVVTGGALAVAPGAKVQVVAAAAQGQS
ncbi:efflux RND transporter periplasmic adaptor subunit [Paraburkholderia sp. SEWSISQ10-3 4]|uniref:efflux RND transporter periplasmic adaptor subunit n=1 Tax=Paraburkholderia TaxID=1822464 RepID=UPI002257E95D|nr:MULTISPECIES: efflux RND transporter periplasmic adaptor subunit [Paraburkholderia]MCX4142856.1 efflux RND transporter periplasmic adaptor subunit [Paraburkholderia aspalathi]MDN7175531.1 efflux RND transporter periplasmic adaptor subunit [Paraburkholderia sp. SEWSISQ10-3 4]MDQ6505172.1 efflux RND transporter periplasmic adaptor subunit [Paraburkholderia aspalathi]